MQSILTYTAIQCTYGRYFNVSAYSQAAASSRFDDQSYLKPKLAQVIWRIDNGVARDGGSGRGGTGDNLCNEWQYAARCVLLN